MAKAVMNMDSRFFILLQRYKDFLKLGNITKNMLSIYNNRCYCMGINRFF